MVIFNYFWLFLAIEGYFTLYYFLTILSNFNIWLLVVLLLVLLVVINGYCYLFYLWLLTFFSGYSVNSYWWLFY